MLRRRWLLAAGLGLVGCGSLNTTPVPAAGDLLSAPTTLTVGGRTVTAEAHPSVKGNVFSVRVRLKADRPPLPPLNVTGVFVVTNAGVWKSPVRPQAQSNCGAKACQQASATSLANGFQVGEGVQVITRLQDAQGNVLWLRDAQARVLREVN